MDVGTELDCQSSWGVLHRLIFKWHRLIFTVFLLWGHYIFLWSTVVRVLYTVGYAAFLLITLSIFLILVVKMQFISMTINQLSLETRGREVWGGKWLLPLLCLGVSRCFFGYLLDPSQEQHVAPDPPWVPPPLPSPPLTSATRQTMPVWELLQLALCRLLIQPSHLGI